MSIARVSLSLSLSVLLSQLESSGERDEGRCEVKVFARGSKAPPGCADLELREDERERQTAAL